MPISVRIPSFAERCAIFSAAPIGPETLEAARFRMAEPGTPAMSTRELLEAIAETHGAAVAETLEARRDVLEAFAAIPLDDWRPILSSAITHLYAIAGNHPRGHVTADNARRLAGAAVAAHTAVAHAIRRRDAAGE